MINKWKQWGSVLNLGAALLAAIGLKLVILTAKAVPFNGDEAIVALMARHIRMGEMPIFFYGQAYMGSLDAWLVAGAFGVFGDRVLSIRIVQILLYGLYMVTLWILARRWFTDARVADLAVWGGAIPPVLVTTYTTASLGGYGESLVLGNVILLIGYEVIYGKWKDSGGAWLCLGLIGGVAFWTLGMAGVYLLPVAVLGLWVHRWKRIPFYLLAGVGFLVGAAPWWWYNLTHQWGAVIALVTSNIESLSFGGRVIGLLVLGIPTLFGFRYPWSPEFAPWFLILFFLLVYLGAIVYLLFGLYKKKLETLEGVGKLLGIFVLTFLAVFLGTHFGKDPTGRYFLPLYLVIALAVGALARYLWRKTGRVVLGIGLIVVLATLNGYDTYRAATAADKLTTQFDPITSFDNANDDELMQFLVEKGETRGYTNYWVSFRLAYLSGEKLIFAARLPYKEGLTYTPLDDRYPLYSEIVDGSLKVAYITTKHPELDGLLRGAFAKKGVIYEEEQIGPYHIFYNLSRAVRPEELGEGLWEIR